MRIRKTALWMLALVALLALTSVGAAATPFPTKYSGKTSQGHPMSLVVGPSGRAVTIDMKYDYVSTALQVRLTNGDKWRVYLSTTRKFRDAWKTDTPVDFPDIPMFGTGDLKAVFTGTVSGLLGRTKAIGTYHEHVTVLDGTGQPVQQLDTGTVRFSLKPKK